MTDKIQSQNHEEIPFSPDEMMMPIDAGVESAVQLVDPKSMNAVIAGAEKYIEFHDRLRKLAIKATNAKDWVNEGDNPYLQATGATKVAKIFGVSMPENPTIIREKISDESDEDYYMYTVSGIVEWRDMKQPNIGTCSTRDSFFGTRKGKFLPLSEVDLTNIKRKAYTNFLNRAIKNLLGLSYTWEEIETMSEGKITKALCTGHSYSSGTKGGKAPESPEAGAKRSALWARIMALTRGDEDLAKEQLEAATGWVNNKGEAVPGRTDINRVTEKQLFHLEKKVAAAERGAQ